MSEDTFHDFLLRAEESGVIDFQIRLVRAPEGWLDFYIHPEGKDGETGDFTVSGGFVVRVPNNMGAGSSRPASSPLLGSAVPERKWHC